MNVRSFTIALLHYSCPPVVGGVEEVVRQQASLFHRYFHNVKIFAGVGKQFVPDYEVEINPLLSSQNEAVLSAHKNVSEGSDEELDKLADELYAYLTEVLRGFDILIAHNVLTMPYNLPLTLAIHRIAEEGELAVVSWNHDSPYFYEDYDPKLARHPWTILKTPHPQISYIAISESRRRKFQELYGYENGIQVIPNGIDPIRFFRLDPATVRLIQEEHLFSEDFLMVQPSRLHPRKNIELSIRVTKALREQGLKARLLVTGAYDPHEYHTLQYYRKLKGIAAELKIEKDVLIMAEYTFKSGERLNADRITMRDLYLIADILFMPSLQEGFGIPLLEAGMLKLPIVCSNIPPFREIGGEDVLIFDLNESPQQIAQRIIDFRASSSTQNFFRRVINNFAWDNIYHTHLLPFLRNLAADG